MKGKVTDLGTLRVPRLFKNYFIPTLFGMLCMSAVTAIDGIFVGYGIGSDGIAAVNICSPLLMIFTGIALMLGVGSSVIASINLSRGKVKIARLNITQALVFITVLTLFSSILILIFPKETAYLLGSSDELLPMVTDYLVWFVPGLTLQMWIAIALFTIRLDGSPRIAMWCSIIAGVVNVVLDWVFIFPLGWGIIGAAFATTISFVVGGVCAVSYLLFFAKKLRLCPVKMNWKNISRSIKDIRNQCHIGSSALLGEATLAILMFVGNQVFMKYLGDDGVGAFGVACYYTPFIFMVGNAIAQSAQPIISYNFGAGNQERVNSARRIALLTATVCGFLAMAMFVFFPKQMVSLFLNPENAAAQIAIKGLPFLALGFIFFIINLTVIGYYQSIEKVNYATSFALLRGIIILIPCFFVMPQFLGTEGIWLAMPVSEVMTSFVILCCCISHCIRKAHLTT